MEVKKDKAGPGSSPHQQWPCEEDPYFQIPGDFPKLLLFISHNSSAVQVDVQTLLKTNNDQKAYKYSTKYKY